MSIQVQPPPPPFSTEKSRKVRKYPEKFSNFSNITGKVRKSLEKYGNLKKFIFYHFNFFQYKLIIQWSFIKGNAHLFFGNPPFPSKTLEMSGKLFKFFKNKMKSQEKSGNNRKVRKSPEKYRNLYKFDFRPFLANLVSFFNIFQLNLNSSITEKSENCRNLKKR